MGERKNNRISMGANQSTPCCPTCAHRIPNGAGGWSHCGHPSNRIYTDGWPNGFTPSMSPSGTCELHPRRSASLGMDGEGA